MDSFSAGTVINQIKLKKKKKANTTGIIPTTGISELLTYQSTSHFDSSN